MTRSFFFFRKPLRCPLSSVPTTCLQVPLVYRCNMHFDTCVTCSGQGLPRFRPGPWQSRPVSAKNLGGENKGSEERSFHRGGDPLKKQPIEQLTNQATNQTTKQPTHQKDSQTNKQTATNQPTNQLIKQQESNQSPNKSQTKSNQTTDRPIKRQPTNQPIPNQSNTHQPTSSPSTIYPNC